MQGPVRDAGSFLPYRQPVYPENQMGYNVRNNARHSKQLILSREQNMTANFETKLAPLAEELRTGRLKLADYLAQLEAQL